MSNDVYAEVSSLPVCLQNALSAVGYGRKDIAIEATEKAQMGCAGGDGYQAFVLLVDLATGRREEHWGSWGGSNMFAPDNPVDCDVTSRPLPPGMAVIRGNRGGDRPVWARILLHPENLVKFLPPKSELTERQHKVLWAYDHYRSGARKEALDRVGVGSTELDAELTELCRLGLVQRNKAGASQITTKGKNAIAGLSHPKGML